MRIKWLILILILGLVFVACQSESSQEETAEPSAEVVDEQTANTEEATGAPKPIPTGEVEDYRTLDNDGTVTPEAEEEAGPTATTAGPAFDLFGGLDAAEYTISDSGLQYYFFEEGDGQPAEVGEMLIVNLVGWLADGSELMNSASFGGPVPLPAGSPTGMVGLDEALSYLSSGSYVRFVIPPELVLAEDGSPLPIPTGSLVFEIEVVEIIGGPPEAPLAVDEENYTVTDSGLKYFDLEIGEGAVVESGSRVSVHYTGWLEDNTVFDSSIGRDPFFVEVDAGQVIAGWDEGLQGMQVGGIRQLVIPPELAYGENGSGSIPPDSTLVFEVKLVKIAEDPPEAPQPVGEEDYTVTDSGLKYVDFEVGTGAAVENGTQVSVEYTGWLEGGTRFDSSIGREPFSFVVGQRQVIAGWDEGLLGMQVGGKRQLVIPPELGYGDTGSGPIPGNAVLIFEVEIIDVR